MPTAVTDDGVELRYETAGTGPTVAFLADVGCGAWQWGWQAPAVAGGFEALVHDARGVGRSDRPEGPYDVATLAADLEAVLATHGADRVHLVGAGGGGLVALEYALEFTRARSLTVIGGAATGDEIDAGAVVGDPEATLAATLSEAFRTGRPGAVERIVEWRRAEDATGHAADAHVAAVGAAGYEGRLYEVAEPALVLHGEADRVVPPAAGRRLAEGLPRGRFDAFEDGAHWVFIEQARLVSDRLVGFLEGVARDREAG